VLEVEQGNHDAQRYAGATGVALARYHGGGLAKQVQIGHGHATAGFAHEEVGQRGFDLMPRHTRGQNSQWMAQVDHVVERLRKKSSVAGQANMRKTPSK
jgi:hypothetical protein